MTPVNAQCRLAARPVGLPQASDWAFTEESVPSPADGELLVRVDYLSIDPAMRTWMNARRSYAPPVEIGDVMRAAGIARVIESRHPDFAVGDEVYGVFGVQLVRALPRLPRGSRAFVVCDWTSPTSDSAPLVMMSTWSSVIATNPAVLEAPARVTN